MAKRYFTTTLPYLNADPHIGFAYELVLADSVARAARLAGNEVFLNTGTDEHGLKIARSAAAVGLAPQVFVDEKVGRFRALLPALGVMAETNFIRTTDAHHVAAAGEFWRRAAAAGDIYKQNYSLKYCVGCELEKTESELAAGRCPLHPRLEIEAITEENYFFRFSKYRDRLLKFYDEHSDFVVPNTRFKELRAFVARGLQDFSVSRLRAKVPWGVPVPDDPEQVMYVWFDALVNYVAAIGWPVDQNKFNEWWPVVQFAGKDNLRQQAAMWLAMLMSAGLPPPRQIVIHGFITSQGQKMSKSLGNVIDPFALVEEYGTEAARYLLLRHVNPFEDTDVTLEKLKEWYNAGLANGLGNLVSRVMKMAVTYNVRIPNPQDINIPLSVIQTFSKNFESNKALDEIFVRIAVSDQLIQHKQPFVLAKSNLLEAQKIVQALLLWLWQTAFLLTPFMPQTAQTIQTLIAQNQTPEKPLFLRVNTRS